MFCHKRSLAFHLPVPKTVSQVLCMLFNATYSSVVLKFALQTRLFCIVCHLGKLDHI